MQKVLEFRELREKVAQNKLACVKDSLNKSLEELSDLKNELVKIYAFQSGEAIGAFDINSRLLSDRYADYLCGHISGKEQAVREKEKEVSEETRQLSVKMQEKKILCNLKDKETTLHYSAMKKTEQKFNDELAITGYFRR